MAELVLHPRTTQDLERCIARPTHAILLVGPPGSGKLSAAHTLAAGILHKSDTELTKYPYFLVVSPNDKQTISIEAVRELQHFTTLKIPGTEDISISRLVIIEAADNMTTEAQNALLKTLEEPPSNTVFILTASSVDALLPTIRSRVRSLQITPPPLGDLKQFLVKSYAPDDVDKALLVSGGLPGLTVSLLTQSESHPLYEATVTARKILQSSAYERLLLVDSLSKQKQLAADVTFILGQMAHMALLKARGTQASRWQSILKAAYTAQESLRRNTQAKLVLINLMLEI